MHHSTSRRRWEVTGVPPGEVVVAGQLEWPGRGRVWCGAGPLLGLVRTALKLAMPPAAPTRSGR